MISSPFNSIVPLSFSSSSSSSGSVMLPNLYDYPRPKRTNFTSRNLAFMPLKCIHKYRFDSSSESDARFPSFSASCLTATDARLTSSDLVADRLRRVVAEFRSLPEPIDRVKRLLHYAALLPPLGDSARAPENRVTGCTTQVWLEAELDELGRVRFRADSDSEISKGFCSCLIYMLDGADPEEVVKVKSEDLADMNVGLHGKSHSRVNTWHNVLIAMQKRTIALLAGS
ncbi:hypothetical protein I3843_05G160400 [Carya illinoinensis]|nr:hypothetical protein I3760_05G175800 [Carya illinoinensis]KAG7980033.1 hypothetical protein I3843_05G160400 [Carya illinoinensis]